MKNIFLGLCAALILGGCGGSTQPSTADGANGAGMVSQSLANSVWSLEKIDGKRMNYAVLGGELLGESAIAFTDKELSGNTGTNQFKARYETKNGELITTIALSTKAMAFHKTLADNEEAIFRVLNSSGKTYKIENSTLTISSPNGTLTYVTPSPLAYSSWVLIQINDHQPNQNGLKRPPLLEFDSNTITGFLGMHMFEANYAITAGGIDVTNLRKVGQSEIDTPEAQKLERDLTSLLSDDPKASFPLPTRLFLGDSAGNMTFMRATLARPIADSKWELVNFAGENIAGKKPTLEFKNDAVFGNGGVNNFNGKFAIQDRKIYFTSLITTMMAGRIEAMDLESRYIKALQNAKYFKFVDYNTLNIFADDAAMTFKRIR